MVRDVTELPDILFKTSSLTNVNGISSIVCGSSIMSVNGVISSHSVDLGSFQYKFYCYDNINKSSFYSIKPMVLPFNLMSDYLNECETYNMVSLLLHASLMQKIHKLQ